MKIPNNQDAIAKSIQRFGKKIDSRITAVGDDGSVCVNAPTVEAQSKIAEIAREWFGKTTIGDGCQTGSIFIFCPGTDDIDI